MAMERETVLRYEEGVSVEKEILSDSSEVWNVVTESPALRIGTIGESEARDLAERLRDVSWIEVL